MIVRVRRRPSLVVVALAGATFLTGCATFDDDAANVDGTAIDIDAYEARLADVADASAATGISADEATGTVEGEPARAVLGLMIRSTATTTFLAANGESITADDRTAFLDTIDPAQLEGLSDELEALLVDNEASASALARVTAPSAENLQRRYEASPASAGVICVRHILVETEAEADEIHDLLEAGDDFAALATERSSDEASAANGGALGTEEAACLDLPSAAQSLDSQFLAAAFAAQPGVPTGPVPSQFGWHVILARPYDEIADSLAAIYAERAGTVGFAGYLATVDVRVDPRYGSWDEVTGSIVALGPPGE